MAKRREEESFTVSDRRLFSSEGDVISAVENPAEVVATAEVPQPTTVPNLEASAADTAAVSEAPPPPSAAEQSVQADAYHQTNRSMDEVLSKQVGAPSAAELEVTFERFLGSLYMTSLMHLGLAHEPNGQPRLDLLSARQTIDTIGLLAEKTKGNLTATEQNFLQNALYELRMAYLEVTNVIARGPQPGASGPGPLVR
jgi:Domain of unknown function (DUF1844)